MQKDADGLAHVVLPTSDAILHLERVMLTAAEAREISGPDAKDYLLFIEEKIRAAAKDKKREVIIREEPYAGWLNGSSPISGEPEKAIDSLRAAGYTVKLYYREFQFVDMGLHIKW